MANALEESHDLTHHHADPAEAKEEEVDAGDGDASAPIDFLNDPLSLSGAAVPGIGFGRASTGAVGSRLQAWGAESAAPQPAEDLLQEASLQGVDSSAAVPPAPAPRQQSRAAAPHPPSEASAPITASPRPRAAAASTSSPYAPTPRGPSSKSATGSPMTSPSSSLVLEQSIALLAEIEGHIRTAAGLAPDQPLGALSLEAANRIPSELLEALEDTLEVIAMAREELARGPEQRGAGQRERGSQRQAGHQAALPPNGSSRITGGGSNSSFTTGASGGGGGALQAYYGSSRRQSFGDRSAGGPRGLSIGSGATGGSPHHHPPAHLPPIAGGSRAGTPLQGSPASLGRPPSNGPGLQRSPSQQGAHQLPQRSGSASRRGSSTSLPAGASQSPGSGPAFGTGRDGSARRGGRARETGPGEERAAAGSKPQRAEAERRKREAQLAADLRFLQQVRQRSAEVQQQHAALLAAADESVRAARSAKAASEAQHRWLQYQDSIAEAAKRHQDSVLLTGPLQRL
ncbi:hypothetical protein GPECTOR_4g975 [Gonium pectorale]|uniref:Uncharacterized protein n=1 Tax=Gonium pectorale TaxID=33097 RepID=A0A150GYS5_GONPE|nr:hypothetical protein GPECTOR_4g975 [Gonium pectorale]|eukprot:KXZ54903.1 hypothetical protein GPECTOR_4g975 [Gonium pectorale]